MSDGRQRLARLMDERRAELALDWNDVAQRAGITKEGLRTVRDGTALNPRPKTRRGIERALHWASGSFDRVLDGGDPETVVPTPAREIVDQQTAERNAQGALVAVLRLRLPDVDEGTIARVLFNTADILQGASGELFRQAEASAVPEEEE
jgi:hypothetical protein